MRSFVITLFLSTLTAGQGLDCQSTEYVPELPGAGRPVAIEAHSARRAALLDRIGNGVILVGAGGAIDLEQLVTQDRDFRPDDYYFYLTGLETPDAWLAMHASEEGEDRITLYLPPRNPRMEQWTGVRLGPGETAQRLSGIDDIRQLTGETFVADIQGMLEQTDGPLLTIEHRNGPILQLVAEWVKLGGDTANVRPTLDSMRVVKDEVEQQSLRRAIEITAEAHKAAMRVVRPGMYEYQIEATIEYTFRNLGADRVGFPSIVGSGPNSTILHYDVNRRRIEEGDLIVADIGAEYGQYTADVTRTFPASGRFTDRQREIYNLVLGTQLAVIDAIRPGITYMELNMIARNYMRSNSGTLCGPAGSGIDCTRYFAHGLGHWLGMRVHDVGDYSMPLEPGMVFTIEPGVYIPDENLGVRIEDDILVTENGCEVLSASAPKTIEEIENLMNSISSRMTRSGR